MKIKTENLIAATIASSWVTLFFADYTFALPVFGFWAVVFTFTLFTKRHHWMRILVAFSAFTLLPCWNFTKGIYDYTQGIGVTHFESGCFISEEAFNLDEEKRLYCLPYGGNCYLGVHWRDVLVNPTYDFATSTMVDIFGFQKNVYHGSYPDAKEANNLVEKLGREVYYYKRNDKVAFGYGNDTYHLGMQINLLEFRNKYADFAKVYILNDELIILKPSTSVNKQDFIYLADAKLEKIFAVYKAPKKDSRISSYYDLLYFNTDYPLTTNEQLEPDPFIPYFTSEMRKKIKEMDLDKPLDFPVSYR